jgi:hypothetical protein
MKRVIGADAVGIGASKTGKTPRAEVIGSRPARLGSQHETIGDQREPTHWEFFGEGPGTVFLHKKGVPGAFIETSESFQLKELSPTDDPNTG